MSAVAIRYGLIKHRDGKCLTNINRVETFQLTSSIRLTSCPCREIPDDVWEFVIACEDYERMKLAPIAGGTSDQAAQFMAGYRVWYDFKETTERILRDRANGKTSR